MVFKTQLFLIITDAITAEATTRAAAITAETLAEQQMVFKTQLFPIIQCNQQNFS
jgi:hypothetical protein